ncbi:hypothetical protein ACFC0M_26285 [Streptomyces sp. NPDC056149]|uniref:hypothetical protein n=1 Tax=Streptomyces sp. NPDC056149 TaxID=3345728 RepID=UPI0035DEE71A
MTLVDEPADCDICTALTRQRDAARQAGRHLTVQSRNAEIANHARQLDVPAELQPDRERGRCS